MPFESEAQRRFMWAKHPEIAERWAHEYPGQHDLPYHKGKKKKKSHSDQNKEASATMSQKSRAERLVEMIQTNAATITRLNGELTTKQAAEKRYSDKIASIVEKCVKCGRIDDTADEREKLAAWLATPEGALEVIDKLAEHVVDETPEVNPLGQQVDAKGRPSGQTKRASADGSGPYVGQRRGEQSAAWQNFASALGISG